MERLNFSRRRFEVFILKAYVLVKIRQISSICRLLNKPIVVSILSTQLLVPFWLLSKKLEYFILSTTSAKDCLVNYNSRLTAIFHEIIQCSSVVASHCSFFFVFTSLILYKVFVLFLFEPHSFGATRGRCFLWHFLGIFIYILIIAITSHHENMPI